MKHGLLGSFTSSSAFLAKSATLAASLVTSPQWDNISVGAGLGVFKTKEFEQFARREDVDDERLCEAADADWLGGERFGWAQTAAAPAVNRSVR